MGMDERDLRSTFSRTAHARNIDDVLEYQVLPMLVQLSQGQTEAAMTGHMVNEKLAAKYGELGMFVKDLAGEVRKNDEEHTAKLAAILAAIERTEEEKRLTRLAAEAQTKAEQDRLAHAETLEQARQEADRQYELKKSELENTHELALQESKRQNEADIRKARLSLILTLVPVVASAVSAIWGVALWGFKVYMTLPPAP